MEKVQGTIPFMSANEYQELALRTANTSLTKMQTIQNAAMGLAGESGEIVDTIKKVCFQGHKLPEEDLKEELGDIMWYIAQMAAAIDTTIEDIMIANIDKLKGRYPNGFEIARSVNRD